MKFIDTVKNLPLLSLLAFSLAASPSLSMAGDNNRGHDKKQHSRDGASYGHKRGDKRTPHQQRRQYIKHSKKQHQGVYAYGQNRNYGPKHAFNKHHGKKHNAHQHNQHNQHRHGYGHGHGHNHTQNHSNRYQRNIIVEERRYPNNYNLRDLRFMFGLHTNNFDIILRD